MTIPCTGACASWVAVEDLCFPCADIIDYNDSSLDDAMNQASDILFFASGQQYSGTCREIVRPCAQRSCSHDYPSCGCLPFQQVELGFHPISSIVGIKVCGPSNPDWRADGSGTCVLDPSLYHIDNFHYLVRDPNPDGTNPGWPNCSYMGTVENADDLFEVDFTYGQPPPSFLKHAAGILACEIYMACSPADFEDTPCRLPRNVQSIVRQGVSIVMQSAFFTPQRGKPLQFGIPELDLALALSNPFGLTAQSVILSPDDDDVARRVGT